MEFIVLTLISIVCMSYFVISSAYLPQKKRIIPIILTIIYASISIAFIFPSNLARLEAIFNITAISNVITYAAIMILTLACYFLYKRYELLQRKQKVLIRKIAKLESKRE